MTLESIDPLSEGCAGTAADGGSLNVPALTRREPRRAQRSYTTRRDTILSPGSPDFNPIENGLHQAQGVGHIDRRRNRR